jgi:hypothetical protein
VACIEVNIWYTRFSQPDPYDGSYDFSDPQSLNRYSYTQNDPVNFVDPTRLQPSEGCGAENSFADCYGSGGGTFWGPKYRGNNGGVTIQIPAFGRLGWTNCDLTLAM